jgi:hypothetical protein
VRRMAFPDLMKLILKNELMVDWVQRNSPRRK